MIDQAVYDIAIQVAEGSDLAKSLMVGVSPLQAMWKRAIQQKSPDFKNLGEALLNVSIPSGVFDSFIESCTRFQKIQIPKFDMRTRQAIKTGRMGESIGYRKVDFGGMRETLREMEISDTRKWGTTEINSALGIVNDSVLDLDILRAVKQNMSARIAESIDHLFLYGEPSSVARAKQQVYDHPSEVALGVVCPEYYQGWDVANSQPSTLYGTNGRHLVGGGLGASIWDMEDGDKMLSGSRISFEGNGIKITEACSNAVIEHYPIREEDGPFLSSSPYRARPVVKGRFQVQYQAAARLLRACNWNSSRPDKLHVDMREWNKRTTFDCYVTEVIEERPHIFGYPVYIYDAFNVRSPRLVSRPRGMSDLVTFEVQVIDETLEVSIPVAPSTKMGGCYPISFVDNTAYGTEWYGTEWEGEEDKDEDEDDWLSEEEEGDENLLNVNLRFEE